MGIQLYSVKFSARQILVILTLFLTVLINWLANFIPINNQTTQEISDSFPVPFTPAGYVFSIWGVIYILLAVYAWYQSREENKDSELHDQVGKYFILSNLFNSIWIVAWHYNQLLASLVLMYGILFTLIFIYKRVGIGKEKVNSKRFWSLHVPFSVYLGWISVATIANTTIVLYDSGWSALGFSHEIWTVILIGIVGVLTTIILTLRKDYSYFLVIVWALVGIFFNNAGSQAIQMAAIAISTLLAVYAAYIRYRSNQSVKQ